MKTTDQKLKEFFAEYEARITRALAEPPVVDIEATMAAFADCFIEANPNGVSCGKNGEEFRAQIPQGFEFYRSIGTKSMKIASLTIAQLDDYHAQAKIHWEAFYKKKDGEEVLLDFDVIYFVQTSGEKQKIFAFITGDEQKAYQEKGLVPS
jgi:hypothetical protein